jgi:hypothetical protein
MDQPTTSENGIERAIRLLAEKAGRPSEGDAVMAAEFGIGRQAVFQWRQQGYAPIDRLRVIEQLTGVPRGELCDPKIAELFS